MNARASAGCQFRSGAINFRQSSHDIVFKRVHHILQLRNTCSTDRQYEARASYVVPAQGHLTTDLAAHTYDRKSSLAIPARFTSTPLPSTTGSELMYSDQPPLIVVKLQAQSLPRRLVLRWSRRQEQILQSLMTGLPDEAVAQSMPRVHGEYHVVPQTIQNAAIHRRKAVLSFCCLQTWGAFFNFRDRTTPVRAT